jgi:hypothetical protein
VQYPQISDCRGRQDAIAEDGIIKPGNVLKGNAFRNGGKMWMKSFSYQFFGRMNKKPGHPLLYVRNF